jgi:tetratricopeptide (TPR) repeat protein
VLNNAIIRRFGNSDDLEGCIEALTFLSELDPTNETARNNLAIAYLGLGIQKEQEGESREALRYFQQALLIARAETVVDNIKRNFAAVYTSLGIREHQNGDYDQSLNRISAAYYAYPNETTRQNLGKACANAAEFCLGRDELQKAISLFEQAQIAGNVDPQLLNDYGVALAKLGRVSDAVREFERGLELAPGDEAIQYNLGLVKSAAQPEYRTANVQATFDLLPQVPQQGLAPAA